MRPTYRYIGPKKIAERAAPAAAGVRVESAEDVRQWLRQTGQELNAAGSVTATFVIDEAGWLRIADRRSEHVACAGGRPVRSAGEMTFAVGPSGVRVTWVTNQSTGYGPEPESWPAVHAALTRAGIAAPDGFSQEFLFRRCPRCGSINIIKDGVFKCEVCSSRLPEEWNLDSEGTAKPVLASEVKRQGISGKAQRRQRGYS
jgi:hypothetical protein